MARAGAQAYNGGLGAEPPAGSRAPGGASGGEAPLKLKAILYFGRPAEAVTLWLWGRHVSLVPPVDPPMLIGHSKNPGLHD